MRRGGGGWGGLAAKGAVEQFGGARDAAPPACFCCPSPAPRLPHGPGRPNACSVVQIRRCACACSAPPTRIRQGAHIVTRGHVARKNVRVGHQAAPRAHTQTSSCATCCRASSAINGSLFGCLPFPPTPPSFPLPSPPLRP